MQERGWDKVVQKIAQTACEEIKSSPWFPVDTGKMRDSAVYTCPRVGLIGFSSYTLRFDGYVCPYIIYNEEGTSPHDIPHAFGKPLPFGIGGRFDGMFHPGSIKNKGFISNEAVAVAMSTAVRIMSRYGKVVRK